MLRLVFTVALSACCSLLTTATAATAQGGVTFEQFTAVATQLGVTGVLALWLWREIKERTRVQNLLEGYLPIIHSTHRMQKSFNKLVGAEEEDDPLPGDQPHRRR